MFKRSLWSIGALLAVGAVGATALDAQQRPATRPPSRPATTAAPAPQTPGGPVRVAGQRGYDHPNQYLVMQPSSFAPNFEPVMPHPEQETAMRQRLAELQRKTGKKPNVFVFLLDDIGYMDFGFNGGGDAVGQPTPDIDRIAYQGLILTSAYSTPTCSPTRATILTGQHPVHHGILIPPMYGMPGGMEGLTSLAQLMSDQGYVTQAIGKWHLGENEGSQPQNVGFDDFRGFLSVSDMYTEWRDPQFNPEVALSPGRTKFMQELPFSKYDVHGRKGQKIENVAEITLDYIKDLDQKWAEYGEAFLRRMARDPKPFFLYYGTRGCHMDNYSNDHYLGRSPGRTNYSDCIVEMNDIFQRLYKVLEETGQLENTLILFTSDNGPEAEITEHAHTPFRGSKGSTWEGGVRVPTFAYWKGMIAPGRSDGLFYLGDICNTALSLAGKPGPEAAKLVPATTYIDGIDQASFLLQPERLSSRRSMLYFWDDKLAAVRIDEFKAHFIFQTDDDITPNGNHGGLGGAVGEAYGSLIFNLYQDPQETDHIGIRHIPMSLPLVNEAARYAEVLKKYPGRVQVTIH